MQTQTSRFPLNRKADSFAFASFTFPKYLWSIPKGSKAKRLEKYKNPITGPYTLAPAPNSSGCFFYLNSDFMPGLRWQYCDEVNGARIRHTGWFTDEYQDGKLRGIVMRLPRGRGFIAGWTMGESMASWVETCIYDDEVRAAYAADDLAECAAEKEREYQEKESRKLELERDIEDAETAISEAREDVRGLLSEIRASVLSPGLCERLKREVKAMRAKMHINFTYLVNAKQELETLNA